MPTKITPDYRPNNCAHCAKSMRARPTGFALVAVVIITAALLALATTFVASNISDIQISRAHTSSTRAYYLAESGTALLIQEIASNSTLGSAFVSGTLTSGNSLRTRANVFESGDQVTISAVSAAPGEAIISATAVTPLSGAESTRRTKTTITRALGDAVADYAVLTGGINEDLIFKISATINGGILFSNDDIKVQNSAVVTAQNGAKIWAHDRIEVDSGATLNGPTRQNVPNLAMPAVDFDSSSPNSWRGRATAVMTPSQFNALPGGSTLNGIIFVNGSPAHLRKDLTVNGLLVINGSFEVENPAHLRILKTNGPSGLIARNSIEIENSTYVEGLIYASNYLEIEYDDDDTSGILDVTVHGGIIGRQVVFKRDRSGPVAINIYHDKTLISKVLSESIGSSPLISIGHWEEEY